MSSNIWKVSIEYVHGALEVTEGCVKIDYCG
ncbi:MAG: hypothetical protein ACI8ZN_001530 [Bacteroidia bacterium]|jgi:hypothetical protein